MHPLLRRLAGGDRRSIGQSDAVAAAVLRDRRLVAVLIDGLSAADPVVRMRAADAVEKVSRPRPGWLQPFADRLMGLAASSRQKEIKWHIAQILPRLDLPSDDRARVVAILMAYSRDGDSRIVQVNALQALADLALEDRSLRPAVRRRLRAATATGSAAVRGRGRKLLARLSP